MRRSFTTCIALISIQFLFGQVQIGDYHDLDALPINGYYDPLDYSPENQLTITHYSDSFEKGKLYMKNGSVMEGLIQFQNKKVFFKKGREKKVKIKPEQVTALTVGIDSFFIATNFNVEQKTGSVTRTNPEFMQHLTSFDGLTFAVHYNFSSGMAQGYGMASAVIKTYQVRKKGATVWKSFPRRKKAFMEMAIPYFDHVPYLKEKILSEKLDYTDMMTLIKTAEYYDKYQKGQLIYFDQFWQEVEQKGDWVYEAALTQVRDSIWTIDYYQGSRKIQTGQFSGFYPNKKNGLFTNYYEDGTGRNLKIYEDNKLVTASHFFPNGTLHYEYELRETSDRYDAIQQVHYLEAKTLEGQLLSKQAGVWTESFDDELTDRQLIKVFDGDKLTVAYRLEGDRKIYQATDPAYDFKVKSLQNKINSHFEDSDWHEAVNENAQGTVFVAVVVNEKGIVERHKILNSLHAEIDEKIKGWASLYLTNIGSYRFKFKPYKIGKEKVPVEFVIPIQFGINKFYREPANYYYDWQFHNMMMQQQMMSVPITPPPAPPGF